MLNMQNKLTRVSKGGYVGIIVLFIVVLVIAFISSRLMPELRRGNNDVQNFKTSTSTGSIGDVGKSPIQKAIDAKGLIENKRYFPEE
jgi:hypothetical protein